MTSSTDIREITFNTIARNVAEILPNIEANDISITGKLIDYGCNSIDRADVVWKTLEDLNLDIPITEFSNVQDINGLTELFCFHLGKQQC